MKSMSYRELLIWEEHYFVVFLRGGEHYCKDIYGYSRGKQKYSFIKISLLIVNRIEIGWYLWIAKKHYDWFIGLNNLKTWNGISYKPFCWPVNEHSDFEALKQIFNFIQNKIELDKPILDVLINQTQKTVFQKLHYWARFFGIALEL